MDYRYLKKEIENDKAASRKNLMELYDHQKDFMINILYKHITLQVKNAIKSYYQNPHIRNNKHVGIQYPTLFKRYYTYEGRADYVMRKIPDSSKVTGNLYDTIGCYDSEWPCISIPESKFAAFRNILDKKLMKDSIRIRLEQNSLGWYNICIIANLGKL